MGKKILWPYFLGFVAFSTYSVWTEGFDSPFPPFEDLYVWQIFMDLFTAITLVSVWVYFDMRERGRPLWHFLIYWAGVAASGSIAPMAYLLLFRTERNHSSSAPSALSRSSRATGAPAS